MLGADPDALDSFALRVENMASTLDTQRSSLGAAIHTSPWYGETADRFRHEWDSRLSGSIAAVVSSLRTAVSTLRANADQQRDASAARPVAPVSAPPRPRAAQFAFTSDVAATPAALTFALRLAQNLERGNAGRNFPGAIAKMEAWQAQLESGTPSAAEVEAFRRYVSLVLTAESMRGSVGDAAQIAVDSFKDASASQVDALKDALGVIPGGGAAGSGTQAVGDLAKDAADGALGGAEDYVQSALAGRVVDAITNGDPAQIVDAYTTSADAMLANIADSAQGVTGLHVLDDGEMVGTSLTVVSSAVDSLRWEGVAADVTHMVTGDGSFVSSIETGVLDAVPGYGQVFSGLQSAAAEFHAGSEMSIGVGSLGVAMNLSMSSLSTEAAAFGIAPRG